MTKPIKEDKRIFNNERRGRYAPFILNYGPIILGWGMFAGVIIWNIVS
jgi:hypothetical protein